MIHAGFSLENVDARQRKKVSTAGSSSLMSRTDDIVELLTSLVHLSFDRPRRPYLIVLSSLRPLSFL